MAHSTLSMWLLALASCCLLSPPTYAQFNPTLWTSYAPLAVRSPYLSAWMNTTDIPYSPTASRAPHIWPSFWNGHTLGWAGHIRVDGTTWKWMGDFLGPVNNSVVTNIQVTPTRTIMNITAGPVDITVTWLSPIEPADPVKQSVPFTYVTLEAQSNDGQSHAVQVYSDISGEWLSDSITDTMNWNLRTTDTIVYHETFLQTPQAFSASPNLVKDSKVYYAMLLRSDMTKRVHTDARLEFGSTGKLSDDNLQGPKLINDGFPLFAISVDMGTVDSTVSKPVTWGVGLLRETPIAYTTLDGAPQQRAAYWKSKYTSPQDAVSALLENYDTAVKRAEAFEMTLLQGATAVSSNYADLIALTARQTMAGTELTVGQNSDGSFNLSDVKMFMQNVGTDSRVNPVEVMYASFPFFLSVNASYGGWLLDPVLEFASSPRWVNPYAPRDIGTNYPNATGNSDAHHQGVEQSGNMLIMLLAHARASGDGSYISKYYPLLREWADYLVNNTSPIPSDQITTDFGSRADSTNLVIKGIIGINAMSEISAAVNNQTDSQHYSSVAKAYTSTWLPLALQSSHIISNFGDQSSSWMLPYNLFAHKMLGMDLIDSGVLDQETAFMAGIVSSNNLGLPISSDANSKGNTAWSMFTAATMTDNNVRDAIVSQLWGYASRNASGTVFPSTFALNGLGTAINGLGAATVNAPSPAVGGIFASLALSLKNVTITVPESATSDNNTKKSGVGPIVGGVVGGVGGFLILLGIGVFFWRRHKKSARYGEKGTLELGEGDRVTAPVPYTYSGADLPLYPPASQTDLRKMASGKERQPETIAPHPAASSSALNGLQSSCEPPSAPMTSSGGDAGGGGNAPRPLLPAEVHGLRTEVENLRRVMQSLQTGRSEPPPGYNEDPYIAR